MDESLEYEKLAFDDFLDKPKSESGREKSLPSPSKSFATYLGHDINEMRLFAYEMFS